MMNQLVEGILNQLKQGETAYISNKELIREITKHGNFEVEYNEELNQYEITANEIYEYEVMAFEEEDGFTVALINDITSVGAEYLNTSKTEYKAYARKGNAIKYATKLAAQYGIEWDGEFYKEGQA